MPNVWTWGEETYRTKEEVRKAVEEFLIDMLTDGNCGGALSPKGRTHVFEVQVRLHQVK